MRDRWAAVADALEGICADAVRGDPPGPELAARLRAVVTARLLREGLRARVVVESDRRGTTVHVIPAPGTPRATALRLTLDG